MNLKRKKKTPFLSTLSVVYVQKYVCLCISVHVYTLWVRVFLLLPMASFFLKIFGQYGSLFPNPVQGRAEKGEERELTWSERIRVVIRDMNQ